MTQEGLKILTDEQLTQVIAWAQNEVQVRTDRRKRETIAKIKEMAGAVGIAVRLGEVRHRNKSTKTKTAMS